MNGGGSVDETWRTLRSSSSCRRNRLQAARPPAQRGKTPSPQHPLQLKEGHLAQANDSDARRGDGRGGDRRSDLRAHAGERSGAGDHRAAVRTSRRCCRTNSRCRRRSRRVLRWTRRCCDQLSDTVNKYNANMATLQKRVQDLQANSGRG